MTLITTTKGPLRGFVDNGIHTFLGVPHAAPITPERRFERPLPVIAWESPRDATRFSAVCPQIPTYGPVGTAATSKLAFGSDFLTLNIRTPDPAGKAPVLFWVHGGGYAVGSANEAVLQSGAFAASGIVEVTVNYRLGALGFLHVPGKPDNRGLLDLIAALEWVRDNIAPFGGDPGRVTLAGRSAGGFAVAALMAMPAAAGLFHRAMPQSGASTAVASLEDANKLSRRFMHAIADEQKGLEDISIARLLDVQRDLCNESYTDHNFERDGSAAMLGVPFVPVIDGETLPEHPEAAAALGRTVPVPMMIGCTTAEYLTHSTAQPPMDFPLCAALLHERVMAHGLSGNEIVTRYRHALPEHDALGIWRAVAGDLVFQLPAIRFARRHSQRHAVFKYLYGEMEPNETGAPHGAELGAVWFRSGRDQSMLPQHQRVVDTTFAKAVHDLWVAFIKGNLSSGPGGAWAPYTETDRSVLHLTADGFNLCEDPFDAREPLWSTQAGEADDYAA